MKQIAFDVTTIIRDISIYTTSDDWVDIPSSRLNLSLIPIYPFCFMLNLNDYLNFLNLSPLLIYFNFNIIENIGVSLFIEDKTKHLSKRTLKSNMLSYMGPQIQIDDLKNSFIIKTMISLQQFINSEEDASNKCRVYPNEKYQSYQECDEEFVYNKIKEKYDVVPFWSTNNMSEVTSYR